MKMRRLALTAALAVSPVLLLASAAGGTTGVKTKQTTGPIRALAMDGSRVAYDVGNARDSHGPGNKVLVWNVANGKVTTVSGRRTDRADTTSTGAGVRELAIAGMRVNWIINQGGISESDDYLCASSVVRPRELKLAESSRDGPYASSPGSWISGLVGSGGTLAVNRRTADDHGAITHAGLYLVGTRSLARIAVGATTIQAQSTDGARIAVLRTDGTVAVYSSSGKVLLTVTPTSAKSLALDGKYLVVLTKSRTFEVYDAKTGSLLKQLPVRGPTRPAAQNLDVQGNVALYTVFPDVRVVSLSTGNDRSIGTLRGFFLFDRVFAQIEPAGVVYAGSIRKPYGRAVGKLVFVPFATVAAAVS